MGRFRCINKNNNGFELGKIYDFTKLEVLDDNNNIEIYRLSGDSEAILSSEYINTYFKPLKVVYEVSRTWIQNGSILEATTESHIFEDRILARQSFNKLYSLTRTIIDNRQLTLNETSYDGYYHRYNDNMNIKVTMKERIVEDANPFM